MNNNEFAKGLQILGERHENDHVTVFDTDWSKVCKEAARIILELEDENKSLHEELTGWNKWYDELVAHTQAEEKEAERDIDMVDLSAKKAPTISMGWDGVRRDVEVPQMSIDGDLDGDTLDMPSAKELKLVEDKP